jgi:hypothetical protein
VSAWPGDPPTADGPRAARLTLLHPAFRRYIRRVRAGLRAPLQVRRALSAELRAQLEGAVAAGATPEQALEALGTPADCASRLRVERGLAAPRDRRRVVAGLACAAAAVALAAGGWAVRTALVADAPPSIRVVGSVAPHGVRAGATSLVAADLTGAGTPLLVGTDDEGTGAWLIAWTVDPSSGAARAASALALPQEAGRFGASVVAAGRFLPGGAQQVIVQASAFTPVARSTLLVVGWRNGGLAVLGQSAAPASVYSPVSAPDGSGRDALFTVTAGPHPTLERWEVDPATSAPSLQASVPVPVAPTGAIDLGAGVAEGRTYVAVADGIPAPNTACGRWGGANLAVLDAATLRQVWKASPAAAAPELPVPGPAGGPLYAQSFGTSAASILSRWDGSAWQPVGIVPCGLSIVGPAPADSVPGAAWLARPNGTLALLGANGQVLAAAVWPFADPLFPTVEPLRTVGSFIASGGPQNLQFARWQDGQLFPQWSGVDSAVVTPSRFLPAAGGGWSFSDVAGNVYVPSGRTWTWQGTSAAQPAANPWFRFDGATVAWRYNRQELTLADPAGRVRWRGALSGDGQRVFVRALQPAPLGGRRTDLAVLTNTAPATGEQLVNLRPSGGGQLRPVARAPGQPNEPYTFPQLTVIPGAGRAEIVISATYSGPAGGQPPPGLAYVWDGRTLRPAPLAAVAPALAAGTALVDAGDRWLAVGVQARGPAAQVSAVAYRLGAKGGLLQRAAALPSAAGSSPPYVQPVPDGSGRVLVPDGASAAIAQAG